MKSKLSLLGISCSSAAALILPLIMGGCPPPQPGDHPAPTAAASVPPPATAEVAAKPSGKVPDANMDRARIPDEFKWKLDAIFAGDEAFEQALGQVNTKRSKLPPFKGSLAKPDQLAECLKLYFEVRLDTNKLTLYANLRADTDQSSTKYQSMHERSLAALSALMKEASFIRQEILALSDAQMNAAYQRSPELKGYKPYIDELRRRRDQVLDPEAERILALAEDNLWAEIDLNEIPSDFEKAYKAVRSEMPLPLITDEQGQQIQLTFANYGKYRASADRKVRAGTVESFFAALRKLEKTYAATFAGQIRYNIFLARSRNYPTVLDAYLHKDNIDPEVYRNLIAAIHQHLGPLHRYVSLRKKLMKVDEVHVYDMYAPLVEGTKMVVPYAEAVTIVPTALAPLGEKYLQTLRTGLDPKSGWIDVYPHKDKESGAFSASAFGIHPYVKMNYLDEVDDLSTLAHEYGHAIHSHLSMTNQPYVTASYVPFIAEIASTINEKLLSDHLLTRAKSDDEKLYILNKLVETIRTTIYRQTLFAEFELIAHTAAEQGKPLTADFLNQTYEGLIRKYYGPEFTVGQNDGIEWAYVPHFYYKYYMFSYATGLSAGIALADKIVQGGEPAREAYLGMLRSGCSKPPLTLLREAGVDLTKPAAIEAAAQLMDKTLSDIEAILAKRPPQ